MSFPLPDTRACYFCEIAAGRSDRWNVLAQDESILLLLNGRQFEVGQCLVVPVRHAPTILELKPPEQAAVMAGARRLTEALVNAFRPDGVLIYQNNGTGSGQEVPHFHMHVVPRRPGSDWGLGPPHIARFENERPAFADHAAVTDAKRSTVADLRQQLGDPEPPR